MYAPFAPALHYNALRGDFVGGNFWDMRATGFRLLNCAAEQAQGPPTNPVEMGLPDSACVAYRISTGPYRAVFERAWGDRSLTIDWPRETEKACSQPAPPPQNDPLPVHLKPYDRQTANVAFDQMALSIAAYEMTPEVSPFTSKYDQVQAGKEHFSAQEKAGYALFRGKAGCNKCHRDGGPGEEPLFTDFTASNLGVPRNPDLPFLVENEPDAYGLVANPDGPAYVDRGVGAFLANVPSFFDRPNPDAHWVELAPKFEGNFQVPTLRNVDMRPRPDFVKAYMHNGYFKSLKEVVHFYNTRDVLPRCRPNDPREKVSCWPPPENPENENKTELGHLGLTPSEEDAVVAFLRTLTDGYDVLSR
jgi:cytochrome c peroxidase